MYWLNTEFNVENLFVLTNIKTVLALIDLKIGFHYYI